MSDTKEKILLASLSLFARDGYEAVSVSSIASSLGITKGALYKHYKNKRDIFDSIVERMYQIDEKRAENHSVPKNEYDKSPSDYKNTSCESLKEFTLSQFEFWTEDEFAVNFRKMLVLEQYRNEKMRDLYKICIVTGPVKYTEDLFCEMIKNGILKEGDPKCMALNFYAPLYLLINASDCTDKKHEYKKTLENHIDSFFEEKLK